MTPTVVHRACGCEIIRQAEKHFSLYYQRMLPEPGAWEWKYVTTFTDFGAAVRYLANEFGMWGHR